jgi:hypothetical protein
MAVRVRAMVAAVVTCSVAACSQGTSGPEGSSLYLLRRVGSQALPAPADPGPQAAWYIADSLRFPALPNQGKDPFVITRITVLQDFTGQRSRTVGQFQATATQDILTIDSCPIGSFCLASLVYAPTIFRVAGDSLFEQLPPGSPYQPRVYSRALDLEPLSIAATVRFVNVEGGCWRIDGEDGTHYEPVGLPAAFRTDGRRVTVRLRFPDNLGSFCMVGRLAEVVTIRNR